jgi:hypothetical protein
MYSNTRPVSVIIAYVAGICTGGLLAVFVIREMVPLRDHVWVVIISGILASPIFVLLVLWYFRVVRECRKAFGEKGGAIVTSLLTFIVVSLSIVFLLIAGLLFSAVA